MEGPWISLFAPVYTGSVAMQRAVHSKIARGIAMECIRNINEKHQAITQIPECLLPVENEWHGIFQFDNGHEKYVDFSLKRYNNIYFIGSYISSSTNTDGEWESRVTFDEILACSNGSGIIALCIHLLETASNTFKCVLCWPTIKEISTTMSSTTSTMTPTMTPTTTATSPTAQSASPSTQTETARGITYSTALEGVFFDELGLGRFWAIPRTPKNDRC